MSFRIVTDSSANISALPGVNFGSVPLKIVAAKEYVDDENLDVAGMVADLLNHKGKSSSSCPNVADWLEAFGDAQYIFAITITKHLSGSYNSAWQAAQMYSQEHPDRKVFVLDSLSTGPAMMMLVDKILEWEKAGMDFEATKQAALDYANHTHTLFCLKSMMNLARNGRTNIAVARIAGLLDIRVAGAVEGGKIVPLCKPRGEKKAIAALVNLIRERGFRDGNILRIAHCFAEDTAQTLIKTVQAEFPNARVHLEPTGGLCSFYAEKCGMIISFEGDFNEKNDNRKF